MDSPVGVQVLAMRNIIHQDRTQAHGSFTRIGECVGSKEKQLSMQSVSNEELEYEEETEQEEHL